MTQTIEAAVKALAEFEAALEKIKSEALEAKRRLVKTALDEAERAKGEAIAKAQELANERVRTGREEAGKTAGEITKRGEESLNRLKAAALKRKEEAVDLVVRRLLGG